MTEGGNLPNDKKAGKLVVDGASFNTGKTPDDVEMTYISGYVSV